MLRLSVDVGGTFTDLVLIDIERHKVWIQKVSSTPGSADGVLRGIGKITKDAGVDAGDIALFFHGLTIATNAWLTRTGARVTLLVTDGFRDVLEIGDQRRPLAYSLTARKPEPLVPRSRIIEVRERIEAFGKVILPLAEDEIERVVAAVLQHQPEAVAISLIFGYANAQHEQRLAAALRQALPGIPVYASSDVNPQIKEYQRTNTTAAAAYLAPPVITYTRSLESSLSEAGLSTRLVYMRSDGGASMPENARANPLNLLMSGPAGGVIGALQVAHHLKLPNIISFDMGGTSTDMAMVRNLVAEIDHGRLVDGLPVSIPMLDIKAISAGGGSIGHVDPAGGLHVGPQSAGASPGPACYRRGGTLATLTDATLVLGYLDPDNFADDEIRLSRPDASLAIERNIALLIGATIEDAALGMVAVASAGMGEAIRRLSVERGYEPGEFALIAFGGAGGIFAPFLLRDIGVEMVVLPPNPGVFAALGLQHADIRHSRQIPYLRPTRQTTPEQLAAAYSEAAQQLRTRLTEDGVPASRQRLIYSADMRYSGQYHELNVMFDLGELGSSLDRLGKQFVELHERIYGYGNPDGAVEIVNLRLDAVGELDKPRFARAEGPRGRSPEPATREVNFDLGGKRQTTKIYRRQDLAVDTDIPGPAIIQQRDTTTLVLPGQRATRDAFDFITVRPE